jgi:hypothetical protein
MRQTPLPLWKRRRSRAPREGTAAIEFAIVALPFFFVILAILELGIIFLVDSTMESAVQQASRLVRTGQAQGGAVSPAQFKTALCQGMSVFEGDCEARATVDVRVIPQFRNPAPPDPTADGQLDPAAAITAFRTDAVARYYAARDEQVDVRTREFAAAR